MMLTVSGSVNNICTSLIVNERHVKYQINFVLRSALRVTINKTFDMDHNTETLKRLSNNNEKPNNQVKLANVGASALPPGNIKCNILKGKVKSSLHMIQCSPKTCLFAQLALRKSSAPAAAMRS